MWPDIKTLLISNYYKELRINNRIQLERECKEGVQDIYSIWFLLIVPVLIVFSVVIINL